MSLNVRRGTKGFIETTRTAPAQTYLGESAVGNPEADPFSVDAQLVVSIDDDQTDEDEGYRTVKTFETNTVFASHARKMLGVDDETQPVEIIETYSEYGDSTIETYTDVEIVCDGKRFDITSQRVSEPMAAMLRAVEHHDKEKPEVTVMRLLGRDPHDNNLPNLDVVFHHLNGNQTAGRVEFYGGGRIYLKEKIRGSARTLNVYDLTHIEVDHKAALTVQAKALSSSRNFTLFRYPSSADGMCEAATADVVEHLGAQFVRLNDRKTEPARNPSGATPKNIEHCVALRDGMVIDMTARQFDEKADFPLVTEAEAYFAGWDRVDVDDS